MTTMKQPKTTAEKLERAIALAKYHGETSRICFAEGDFHAAQEELKVATRWQGVVKRIVNHATRKGNIDALLQATIVYPFDIETYG
jgi:hypothetical protein